MTTQDCTKSVYYVNVKFKGDLSVLSDSVMLISNYLYDDLDISQISKEEMYFLLSCQNNMKNNTIIGLLLDGYDFTKQERNHQVCSQLNAHYKEQLLTRRFLKLNNISIANGTFTIVTQYINCKWLNLNTRILLQEIIADENINDKNPKHTIYIEAKHI